MSNYSSSNSPRTYAQVVSDSPADNASLSPFLTTSHSSSVSPSLTTSHSSSLSASLTSSHSSSVSPSLPTPSTPALSNSTRPPSYCPSQQNKRWDKSLNQVPNKRSAESINTTAPIKRIAESPVPTLHSKLPAQSNHPYSSPMNTNQQRRNSMVATFPVRNSQHTDSSEKRETITSSQTASSSTDPTTLNKRIAESSFEEDPLLAGIDLYKDCFEFSKEEINQICDYVHKQPSLFQCLVDGCTGTYNKNYDRNQCRRFRCNKKNCGNSLGAREFLTKARNGEFAIDMELRFNIPDVYLSPEDKKRFNEIERAKKKPTKVPENQKTPNSTIASNPLKRTRSFADAIIGPSTPETPSRHNDSLPQIPLICNHSPVTQTQCHIETPPGSSKKQKSLLDLISTAPTEEMQRALMRLHNLSSQEDIASRENLECVYWKVNIASSRESLIRYREIKDILISLKFDISKIRHIRFCFGSIVEFLIPESYL